MDSAQTAEVNQVKAVELGRSQEHFEVESNHRDRDKARIMHLEQKESMLKVEIQNYKDTLQQMQQQMAELQIQILQQQEEHANELQVMVEQERVQAQHILVQTQTLENLQAEWQESMEIERSKLVNAEIECVSIQEQLSDVRQNFAIERTVFAETTIQLEELHKRETALLLELNDERQILLDTKKYLENLDATLSSKDQIIYLKTEKIDYLESKLREMENRKFAQNRELVSKNEIISSLQFRAEHLSQTLQSRDVQAALIEGAIRELEAKLLDAQETIKATHTKLEVVNKELDLCNYKLATANRQIDLSRHEVLVIHESRSWRLAAPFRFCSNVIRNLFGYIRNNRAFLTPSIQSTEVKHEHLSVSDQINVEATTNADSISELINTSSKNIYLSSKATKLLKRQRIN